MPDEQPDDPPHADRTGVTFRLADPEHAMQGVRLLADLAFAEPLDFERDEAGWQLRLDRPDADRIEYQLELVDRAGQRSTVPDPGNPLRVDGAFGAKSVVRFPEYREPEWLGLPETPSTLTELRIPSVKLPISGQLWAPRTLPPDKPAPLLVVHDGPEYARLGAFTRYLGAQLAAGALPPLRAVLLAPGDRNAWYAANREYAATLVDEVLPRFAATMRVGVGVSLGGLAMLHAHHTRPGTFDGLLLQSGSFFRPDLDPQERDFSGFAAVTAFVAEFAAAASRPIPVTLTCGLAEENLANNRAMASDLARLDYPLTLAEVRDAHNYTAWRDALHPNLSNLLSRLVHHRAA